VCVYLLIASILRSKQEWKLIEFDLNALPYQFRFSFFVRKFFKWKFNFLFHYFLDKSNNGSKNGFTCPRSDGLEPPCRDCPGKNHSKVATIFGSRLQMQRSQPIVSRRGSPTSRLFNGDWLWGGVRSSQRLIQQSVSPGKMQRIAGAEVVHLRWNLGKWKASDCIDILPTNMCLSLKTDKRRRRRTIFLNLPIFEFFLELLFLLNMKKWFIALLNWRLVELGYSTG